MIIHDYKIALLENVIEVFKLGISETEKGYST